MKEPMDGGSRVRPPAKAKRAAAAGAGGKGRAPLVAIEPVGDASRLMPTNDASGKLVARANQVLQVLPSLGVALPPEGHFRLVNDITLAHAADGTLWGHSRSSSQSILQHGKFRPVAVGPGQVAALAVGVLSIVVAQAHLADIGQSLRSIDAKLDKIIGHLEGMNIAKVLASMERLSECMAALDAGRGGTRVAAVLDEIDAGLSTIQIFLEKALQKALVDFDTIEDRLTRFGIGAYLREVEAAAAGLVGTARLLADCAAARAFANSMLDLLGEPTHERMQRVSYALDLVDKTMAAAETVASNHMAAAAGAPLTKLAADPGRNAMIGAFVGNVVAGGAIAAAAYAASDRTTRSRKRKIEATHGMVKSRNSEVSQMVIHYRALLTDQPPHIVFELDDGRVTAVSLEPRLQRSRAQA